MMCEIVSKLKIKTSEGRVSGVFIVNFEQISHIALVLLLLIMSKYLLTGMVVNVARTNERSFVTLKVVPAAFFL